MKCFVLAGGSGDRLWPLSRKNFPKQFMQVRDNRSMFQDTIARNLALADEFFIITSERYHNIVEGQLQAFQGLKYRLVFEEVALKTAPAIVLCSMFLSREETVLIVSTDHIIEGGNYNACILQAKEVAGEENIAVLGVPVKAPCAEYGYMKADQTGRITFFRESVNQSGAKRFCRMGGYYWDAGILLAKVSVILREFESCARELYCKSLEMMSDIDTTADVITLKYEQQSRFPAVSFGEAIIKHSVHTRLVPADFYWNKIIDFQSFYNYVGNKFKNRYIENNARNNEVINYATDKLVVLNGVQDIMVVNTDDAVYVTKKDASPDIKGIMRDNYTRYQSYFDNNKISYKTWGTKEYLATGDGYQVRKITIYPGRMLSKHVHLLRNEQWSVVKGVATVFMKNKERDVGINESIFIPVGVLHQIKNRTTEDLVLIVSSIGEDISAKEDETVCNDEENAMIRLSPAFKDYIWGGTKIRDVLKKDTDMEKIAESWELSTHPVGESLVASGRFAGETFASYLQAIGRERLGWKCQPFEKFPLLIKFIDAKDSLSIQVHPNDDYALPVEGEYGKNEMWYIMDCEPNSYLYVGFNKNITKEEIRTRIANDTLAEVLNKVPVQKGKAYFLEAGTVHAIGAGIFICEIQQSSDATYRLYDYGRRDKNGELRPLHIEKALDVINLRKSKIQSCDYPVKKDDGFTVQLLGECKYFTTRKYVTESRAVIYMDTSSFLSVVFLRGEGEIQAAGQIMPFKTGDSFFVPAGKRSVVVVGNCEFLATCV